MDDIEGADEWSPPGYVPVAAHLLVLEALDAARARVAAVRALHQPVSGFGRKCCGACLGFPPWPCATIRALDAVPAGDCTVTASCGPDDHSRSWPCDYAPGTGRLAESPSGGA